jgi:hypothetical protein
VSKFFIACCVCGSGAAISTLFCFNWGFTFFDVVDHYLNTYTIMLMGLLQAVVIGWYFCFNEAWAKSKGACLVMWLGYYCLLIPLAWMSYFAYPDFSWTGLPVFWLFQFMMQGISLSIAVFKDKMTFREWYEDILFSGVKPIAERMLSLTTSANHWFFEEFFTFWWCTSIKWIFPWAIYWMIVMTIKADIEKPYSKYYWGW